MTPSHYARGVAWAWDIDLGSLEPSARVAAFVLGAALLVITIVSIVRTMVIPRASISFIYAIVLRSTDAFFGGFARLARGYPARDRILAWSGPIGVIVALIVWLALFLVAYALLTYSVSTDTFAQAVLQAGSGLFTLGIIGTPTDDVTAIDFMAAMTGPAVIALLIGFLPTLYQSYIARESRMLLATSLTGAPAWGPETLARVQLLEGDADVPDVYLDWIPWCAQVRLTQTLYPALSRFRSPVGSRHWLISLIAVLDSAALRLAIRPGAPDPRTIALIAQGSQAILTISATEVGIDSVVRLRPWRRRVEETLKAFGMAQGQPDAAAAPSAFEDQLPARISAVSRAITLDNLSGRLADQRTSGIRYDGLQSTLPRSEFDKALAYIRSAGVDVQRTDDAAYAVFTQVRGRYEAAAYRLAERFTAPRAPWTGDRQPETPVVYPTLAADEPES